jgi:hypothetical protein
VSEPPKEVRLLGRTVAIQSAELDHDGECGDGIVFFNAEDDNPDNVRDTVVHELIHHYDAMLDLKLKEKQVRRLAVCVLQLVKDNPEFIQWLQARG